MKACNVPSPEQLEHELAALITTLHETEQRLEELTGGQVDTVSDRFGRPYLLRHAQEEQRDREADKQTAILNALPAHIALLDANGVIITVNEPWRRFAAANDLQGPADGIGLNYLDVCNRASGTEKFDAQRSAAGIGAVLAGKENFTLEYPCHSPAEKRWFLMIVTPLRRGRAHGAVVMHLDITERKQSEQATARALQRLTEAQRIAQIGDWEWDLATQAITWSPQVYAILGRDPNLGPPRNYAEHNALYDAPSRVRLETHIRRAIESGEVQNYELVGMRPDGARIDVQAMAAPRKDESGKVVGIYGTVQNITERKQAELVVAGKNLVLQRQQTELQASERRFRALFEQAAVGVVLAEALTGRFVQVNQRFADILGRSRAEVEGLTFSTVTHPQDMACDEEMLRQLIAGRIREYAREKRYLRKDGTVVWVSLTVSAMWEPGETPGLCIAVVQDITERKRLDEHFLQSQKMEALGQFSGGVAHDFNNILAAISGYTELAKMQLGGKPAVLHHLDSVLKATGRASDLVKQILTFSRQQPQDRQAIRLQQVVEDSIKLLRATIPTTIAFEISIAADAPTVLGNANQINQVLTNLGINAWHAMQDGPGRLEITVAKWQVDEAHATVQPRLRPGSYARVSISDTGCGMDAATVRRIFEPFFTTKPVGKGTGLGLAVVHGIMDGHDGAVTVYSQPGAGTIFHLYFPAHVGEANPSAIAEGPTPQGKGEAVLVVDDEEMIASMLREVLNHLDYAAEATSDPTAALALVQADPAHFDLVLSDLTMPGMTGLDLATRLREIRPDLPVLLMTGLNATLTPARLEAAGVRQVLIKPLTVQLLGDAMHAALTAQPH